MNSCEHVKLCLLFILLCTITSCHTLKQRLRDWYFNEILCIVCEMEVNN